MASEINYLDKLKVQLNERGNAIIQGGAGSGKTEMLKEVLNYLEFEFPFKKVLCITHTNLAVDEIRERAGDRYEIKTIHSFLNDTIKDFKKNIKEVIQHLFLLDVFTESLRTENMSESDYRKTEHTNFKKIYNKHSKKYYEIHKIALEKVVGKRQYDIDYQRYNNELNTNIHLINDEIHSIIRQVDYNVIKYNETKFDSFRDLSFGHDGLLIVASKLFLKYPILGKILSDKYDYILIDEYQDTNGEVLKSLIEVNKVFGKPNLFLFGDVMQAIYPDGVGSIQNYVDEGLMNVIQKQDNYRCSQSVIDFINILRLDTIKQEIALKNVNGIKEKVEDRQGEFNFFYLTQKTKPHSRSSIEEKESYLDLVDRFMISILDKNPGMKTLLLTNKAIAERIGFKYLYGIFDKRYVEVGDKMEEILSKIQIMDLCEICQEFNDKQYNLVIKKLVKNGFKIKSIEDKKRIKDMFSKLTNSNLSVIEAINYSITNGILSKSETFVRFLNSNVEFVKKINEDGIYILFKKLYLQGHNTFSRIKDNFDELNEYEFINLERNLKRERFYNSLISEDLKFQESVAYYDYINEKSNFITMHKTKGSSINRVLVVWEEFFWSSEYDFSELYSETGTLSRKGEKSQKLIYVACSRAEDSLVNIAVIKEIDEQRFLSKFPFAQKAQL